MKKGDLVKILSSTDETLIGQLAIVLGIVRHDMHVCRILCPSDGWIEDFHVSRLEMVCEGR